MDQEKIQQYSTLIADFYGKRLHTDKEFYLGVQKWRFPFTNEHIYKVSEMQFDTNWHWLMLAGEKLKKHLWFLNEPLWNEAFVLEGHTHSMKMRVAIVKFDLLSAFENCALTIKWYNENRSLLFAKLEQVIMKHVMMGDYTAAYTLLYSNAGIFPNKEIDRVEQVLINAEPEKNHHDTYRWKVWTKFNEEVPNWTDLPYVE